MQFSRSFAKALRGQIKREEWGPGGDPDTTFGKERVGK